MSSKDSDYLASETVRKKIRKIAYARLRLVRSLNIPLDVGDLIHAGTIGVMLAQKTYAPERGPFLKYAEHFIVREISEEIKRQSPVIPWRASHDTRPISVSDCNEP